MAKRFELSNSACFGDLVVESLNLMRIVTTTGRRKTALQPERVVTHDTGLDI